MERRTFLKHATTGLTAGAAAVAAPAIHAAESKIKWRMTSSFPKSLPPIYGASELLAERLREITDGNFDIRIFPAGDIVPGLQALDAVQQGTVEMCHSCSYYVGKNKAFGFGTAIPFGLNARQMDSWITQGGGQKLLDDFYADYNVYSFLAGSSGAQMGGWFRKKLESADDLKGLKMRIAGLGGEVMARLGAIPQQVAASDIYPALEKGTLDAVEWVAPFDDEKLGFQKVAKYYYAPGWWEPGPTMHFYVNRQAWDKLPKTYQAAFRVASREAHIFMHAMYDKLNPEGLARLLQQGVQLETFPQDVMKKAYEAAMDLYAEESKNNPAWAKIYLEYEKYRKAANAWFSVSEYQFDRFIHTMR